MIYKTSSAYENFSSSKTSWRDVFKTCSKDIFITSSSRQMFAGKLVGQKKLCGRWRKSYMGACSEWWQARNISEIKKVGIYIFWAKDWQVWMSFLKETTLFSSSSSFLLKNWLIFVLRVPSVLVNPSSAYIPFYFNAFQYSQKQLPRDVL